MAYCFFKKNEAKVYRLFFLSILYGILAVSIHMISEFILMKTF